MYNIVVGYIMHFYIHLMTFYKKFATIILS